MKNSLIVAFALAAVPQAYALDVSFPAPLAGSAATVNGQVIQRLGAGSTTASWSDQVFFTMGVAGSFSARVKTVYDDSIDTGTTTTMTFGNVPSKGFTLFDITSSEAFVGDFQPATPSSRDYDFNLSFGNLLAGHHYRLDVVGRITGNEGSASYTIAYTPPVPEPSTYALLALGLGAVGLMRRSRMRRDDA